MITIHAERCDGCGACLEVCPHGALYLLEGKAVVDETLCRECEACVAACPTEAIVITDQVAVPVAATALAARPAPHVIPVETQPATVSLRTRMLPAVGAALSWAGRELVPRLAYYVLEGLDRRTAGQPGSTIARRGSPSGDRQGRGRQQRRRHRGGRSGSGCSPGF